MKNKLQLIDINIVSEYMGRFLTAIVTVLVLALTVSALVSEGGIRGNRVLVVEVTVESDGESIVAQTESLKYLIARESGSSVEIRPGSGEWCEDCDLFILPVREFLTERELRGLQALYAAYPDPSKRDAAVLIARHGNTALGTIDPGSVVFTDPDSPNGCWLQLYMLESKGFTIPGDIAALRFAPDGRGAAWVVFSVLFGEYTVGACRQSDLSRLVAAGSLNREDLAVVSREPAIPETILAARPESAEKMRTVLDGIAALLSGEAMTDRERAEVDRLRYAGIGSLLPVSDRDLDRAAELFERMEGTGITSAR
jgi:hypothetical protein